MLIKSCLVRIFLHAGIRKNVRKHGVRSGMQILMDRKECSIFPLGKHLSRAKVTWSDWGCTINQHCKMWIRTRLFGLLHYALYNSDHSLNETIRPRIPQVRVLHFKSVLHGKFEFLGHKLGSHICVHRCWYPMF